MKNPFRADLHCHSICSDGTLSPVELIDLAIELKLSGLSITDHDTIKAYDTAAPYAKEKNFPLLTGIEYSCHHRGVSVHILGFGFNLKHPELIRFCELHKIRRIKRCRSIVEKLNQHQMLIELDEEKLESIGRPHIAMELIKKGYIQTLSEGFRKYLGEGCACYVPGEAFSVEETIDVIHRAGGVAIIAHPHLIKQKAIVTDLLKMPFDGIEAYYARFAPHQESLWIKIGQYRNWIITGGSDFHGSIKQQLPLGCSWVNQETFQVLYERCHSNNS